MKVEGRHYRTIWVEDDGRTVGIIDQTQLPHRFATEKLVSLEDAAHAIRAMLVRGAPLVGVTAAYGLALAVTVDARDEAISKACSVLRATRPTAVNLEALLTRVASALAVVPAEARASEAYRLCRDLADEDVAQNAAIGRHGLALFAAVRKLASRPSRRPLQVMTHCNAGWLATVDMGTALAPVYAAHEEGLDVHVWVSETRPRNQGASLTAWELGQHGVPYTVIVDNAAGHLLQNGAVDVVIVGTDRTTSTGDVANKIGTYLKAVAARDCGVPFYVAAPSSSIDWNLRGGKAIPIEERGADEVTHAVGLGGDGRSLSVRLVPRDAQVKNYGFDVTPARLVTAIVTERGSCDASEEGLSGLFPERASRRTAELR